jgi:hypothetical protein
VGGRSPRGDLPASSGGEDRLVPSSASRPRRRAATCPRAAGGPAFRAAIRGNDDGDRCREVSARGRAGRAAVVWRGKQGSAAVAAKADDGRETETTTSPGSFSGRV